MGKSAEGMLAEWKMAIRSFNEEAEQPCNKLMLCECAWGQSTWTPMAQELGNGCDAAGSLKLTTYHGYGKRGEGRGGGGESSRSI